MNITKTMMEKVIPFGMTGIEGKFDADKVARLTEYIAEAGADAIEQGDMFAAVGLFDIYTNDTPQLHPIGRDGETHDDALIISITLRIPDYERGKIAEIVQMVQDVREGEYERKRAADLEAARKELEAAEAKVAALQERISNLDS